MCSQAWEPGRDDGYVRYDGARVTWALQEHQVNLRLWITPVILSWDARAGLHARTGVPRIEILGLGWSNVRAKGLGT